MRVRVPTERNVIGVCHEEDSVEAVGTLQLEGRVQVDSVGAARTVRIEACISTADMHRDAVGSAWEGARQGAWGGARRGGCTCTWCGRCCWHASVAS